MDDKRPPPEPYQLWLIPAEQTDDRLGIGIVSYYHMVGEIRSLQEQAYIQSENYKEWITRLKKDSDVNLGEEVDTIGGHKVFFVNNDTHSYVMTYAEIDHSPIGFLFFLGDPFTSYDEFKKSSEYKVYQDLIKNTTLEH